MKLRFEALAMLAVISYLGYFVWQSGELSLYFINVSILLPFVLVLIALLLISYGWQQLWLLIKASQVLWLKDIEIPKALSLKSLTGAINYCYVSAFLWIFYILVVTGGNLDQNSGLIPNISLALFYAFVVPELVLRPMRKRLAFLMQA